MTLQAWAARRGYGSISFLMHEAGVAYTTAWRAVKHGRPIRDHNVAVRLSEATGGEVSVDELCNPQAYAEREAAE